MNSGRRGRSHRGSLHQRRKGSKHSLQRQRYSSPITSGIGFKRCWTGSNTQNARYGTVTEKTSCETRIIKSHMHSTPSLLPALLRNRKTCNSRTPQGCVLLPRGSRRVSLRPTHTSYHIIPITDLSRITSYQQLFPDCVWHFTHFKSGVPRFGTVNSSIDA